MQKITLLFLMIISMTILSQEKLESSITYNNDLENSKTEYTYDNEGNLTEELNYFWNELNSVWINGAFYTYTYNSNNKIIEYLSKEWNGTTYENDYKAEYIYNTSSNLIEVNDYEYDNSEWVLSSELELNYVDGKLDNYLNTYDGQQEKNEINYNEDDLIESTYEYLFENEEFVQKYRVLYFYNANGKLYKKEFDEFVDNVWESDSEELREYDTTGNIISYVETYDAEEYITTYSYDTNSLIEDYIHPFKDTTGLDYFFEGGFNYISKLVSEDNNGYNTVYSYSDNPTASIDDVAIGNVSVYPNPSKVFVTVSVENGTLNKIELYNLIGKKVLISNDSNVDLSDLSNGVYILKALNEKGNFITRKIIKN